MKERVRVCAYCRVSTDKDDQRNSLSSQKQYFDEYIKRNELWEFVRVYADEGISGTGTKKRVQFNEMIEDAYAGKIDLILTKEVSRFARNTVDTLNFTRALKSRHVGVLFIGDNIDTRSNEGEFRLTIMASVAQEESRKTSERVKWGQQKQMERGVVFGTDLLGYRVKEGVLSINEEEVDTVRLIFHKFLYEGKGTHVIARELREGNSFLKTHRVWSNTAILRVLRNEKYVGDLIQKKTYTPSYLNHDKKYNRGQEDKVIISDHHTPIISRALWNQTQAELARRSPTDERKSKHSNRYWCSGKIVCGECGARFVARTRQQKSSIHKSWRCYESTARGRARPDANGGVIGCNSNSINDKTLLSCCGYVIELLSLNKKQLVAELMADIESVVSGSLPVDILTYTRQLEKIEGHKLKALHKYNSNDFSKEDFTLLNHSYDEQVTQITKKISLLKEENSLKQQQQNQAEHFQKRLREMTAALSSNEFVCKALLDTIKVYNDSSMILYLNGIDFGVKLAYSTSGKMGSYTTVIEDVEQVNDSL